MPLFSKTFPWSAITQFLPELLLRIGRINCLIYEEKIRESYNDNLCLFRALAFHLYGTQRLEAESSLLFNLFINKDDGLSANKLQGVHMNEFPSVEDLLTLNFLLYDIDIMDANIVEELARRSKQKYEQIVQLVKYNNHLCYVSNINAVYQFFAALILPLFSTEPSIWRKI